MHQGLVARRCRICVVFVSDEWAVSWCPATRSKVCVTSGFPAAWRTMGDTLVMWQGGHGSSLRHKIQAVGSLQRRNRFESHRKEFLTAVKAEQWPDYLEFHLKKKKKNFTSIRGKPFVWYYHLYQKHHPPQWCQSLFHRGPHHHDGLASKGHV